MFTNTKCSIYAGQDKVYTESVCLSTDSKPTTGIANGSVCIEMNTGKKFMFDEASDEWVEVPSSGGGGGGGSSDFSTAQVTIVYNDPETYFERAAAVIQDGKMYFEIIGPEATYTMPLYKGSVILPNFNPISVSGNAEIKGSGLGTYVEITGDCSITVGLHV